MEDLDDFHTILNKFGKHVRFDDRTLACGIDFRLNNRVVGKCSEAEMAQKFQTVEKFAIFHCPDPALIPHLIRHFSSPNKLKILILASCKDFIGLTSCCWSSLRTTLANLERLEIGDCRDLRNFEPEILCDQMENLKELFLFGMSALESLPSEIKSMTKLESLVLESCKNLTVPDEVFSIRTLKRVSVTNCRQVIVPPCIGQLQDLEILELKDPEIRSSSQDLPSEIGELKELKHLSVVSCFENANPTVELDEPARPSGQKGELSATKTATDDSETLYHIPSIPSTVVNLENLQTLTLHESVDFINTLPCIPQLKSLSLLGPTDEHKVGHNILHGTAWKESTSLESLSIHSFRLGERLDFFLRSLPRTLRTLKVFSCNFGGVAVEEEEEAIGALLNEKLPRGLRDLVFLAQHCNNQEIISYDQKMDCIRKLLEKYEQLVSVKIDLGRTSPHNEWSSQRFLKLSLEDNFLLNFNKCGRVLLRSSTDDDDHSNPCANSRDNSSTRSPSIPLSVWSTVLARVGKIMDREMLVTRWADEVQASILFRLLQGPAFLSRPGGIPRGATYSTGS